MNETMNKTMMLWTALLSGLVFLSPAFAEEESEKVKKARLENELEKEAERTDQACGTKLTIQIEWAGFLDVEGWQGKSVSGYCEAPLGALRSLCEGPAAKAHIQKAVKAFVCKAARDKAGWKVVLKGGNLEWSVPPDSVNNGPYAKEQLLRNL